MATELADKATHEEIQEFVDNIVEDRKEEETPEPKDKGDSQKIAEERDEPTGDMTAETDSGSEDTADKGEETGDSEDQAWLDDTLKAEVAAYGIDEKEIADFTSREEVERALRFFDKSALEAGRKAMADKESKTEPESKSTEEKSTEGKHEITLDEDVYDEGLVAELTKMSNYYESRFAELEARVLDSDAKAEEQQCDSIIDSLGHADLFGKTGKETKAELQRRQDLVIAAKAQQIGLQTLGRQTDLDESLFKRVARMVFADELGKKELKARTRKMSKQSNGRTGGSATKVSDPLESARDIARRRYKELDAG